MIKSLRVVIQLPLALQVQADALLMSVVSIVFIRNRALLHFLNVSVKTLSLNTTIGSGTRTGPLKTVYNRNKVPTEASCHREALRP
jgi:hypothetical protein